METATIVPVGQSEHSFGMEVLLPEEGRSDSDYIAFGPAYQYRRGIMDRVDAAVRVFFLMGIEAGVRFQLLKGPLTIAIGGQASTSLGGVTISERKSKQEDKTLIMFQLPAWISFELSSSLSIMLVPRFAYGSREDNSDRFGAFYGSTIALPINLRKGVVLMPHIGLMIIQTRQHFSAGIALNF